MTEREADAVASRSHLPVPDEAVAALDEFHEGDHACGRVRAIAAPVVAAELRRLAAEQWELACAYQVADEDRLADIHHGAELLLRQRADALDAQ